MNKEQIARHLAKTLIKESILTKESIEDIILKELTVILYKDKGRLTPGTLKE